jgi:electron transfer flavoprotein alpha subunit
MKALLICEYRDGKLLDSSCELIAFADRLGADVALVLIGDEAAAPRVNATIYCADAATYGEYNPEMHKRIVLAAFERENPDYVVFVHSSFGWDLAPRIAVAIRAGQISEIVDIAEDGFEVCSCNAKLRRCVAPKTEKAVLTIQAGAFRPQAGVRHEGGAHLERIEVEDAAPALRFVGYEQAERSDVDLAKAEVIVSAGRGVRKKENMPVIAALAAALHGELGASRPVTDAGWLAQSRQIGITGQVVSPRLYNACGISGAVQHLAGLRNSDFVVAINTDRDAPIGAVADVLVVADLMQFVPVLTAKLQ